jgi:hypothetical protein
MLDASTALQHAQIELLGDTIEIVYQKEPDFVNRMERVGAKEKTNFRGRREPLEIGPNPSLSFGSPAGGDLANPNSPLFNHLLIPYVWFNLGLETAYDAILNQGVGTTGNIIEQSAESTAKTLVKWLNIFASNGDGTTRIALVSARTSNTVLTCDDSGDSIGATQVLQGQRVTVWDPTGTTQRVGTVGSGAIIVLSTTGTTVTADATNSSNWPSDVIANDIIVPQGTTPSVGIKGMPYIINNTGDYFGLNRSTYKAVRSTVVAASAALSATFMQQLWERVRQRTGQMGLKGHGVLEWACALSQHEKYSSLLTKNAYQVGVERPAMDVGFAAQEFTWFGVPINEYLDYRGDRMDLVNFSYLKVANLKDPGTMKGMPISDELQSFNGTTGVYKAAKARYLDAARDHFTSSAFRFGTLNGLTLTGLSQQKNA